MGSNGNCSVFRSETKSELERVQPASVGQQHPCFRPLLRKSILCDYLGPGCMEDLRSLNMVIVEMRIDDMANGQPTDLAEFTEGRPGGGHTISRVDHNHASISDHIK